MNVSTYSKVCSRISYSLYTLYSPSSTDTFKQQRLDEKEHFKSFANRLVIFIQYFSSSHNSDLAFLSSVIRESLLNGGVPRFFGQTLNKFSTIMKIRIDNKKPEEREKDKSL